jgi:hypothetical protein
LNKFFLIALFTVFFSFSISDAYAANANLFISSENSQFDNYMSGSQVIEVIIIDSDIDDTNEPQGEPDVTVNGKILRMAQSVDGNWYGYFADRYMAITADRTTTVDGTGLDFGYFCASDDQLVGSQSSSIVDFSDTVGFTINSNSFGVDSDSFNGTIIPFSSCGQITGTQTSPPNSTNNVIRESKDVNISSGAADDGQIGISPNVWPVVQLYALNPTGNVVVQYNKGGGAQTTTLTFDEVDQFAEIQLNKSFYERGENVMITITDPWLNIDPTSQDSWTFGVNSTNYYVFDDNGNQAGDSNNGVVDISLVLVDLMCKNNCALNVNPDIGDSGFVFTLQDNAKSVLINVDGDSDLEIDPQNPFDWATAGGYLDGTIPITITEITPKSGVFASFDDFNKSNVVITDNATNGSSASISYDQNSVSFIALIAQDCMVPESGNWTITQDCNLVSSSITPASVLVLNNTLVTIPAGLTLTIPSGHNITIELGSGVLIKSTGNLVVLS